MSAEASTAALAPSRGANALPLRRLLIGLGWAAVSVAIFSGWFVVTRFSVLHVLRVWDVIALRFGGGVVLLLPALLKTSYRLPRHALRNGLLLALMWGAPFVLLVAFGLRLTSAAQAAAVTPALMPVFAGLFGWIALREAPGVGRLLGYGAIIGGLVALVAGNALVSGAPSPAGIGALVLAAAMWAVYTLRFHRTGLTPLQAAALVSLWSALLFLPAYFLLGLSHLGEASLRELAFQALYQGCLMSAVAIITFNRAVALLGAGAAAAIVALLPVIASVMAIPVLGEIPTPLEGAAIAVIAFGVILAARPARSTPQSNRERRTP